MRQIVFIVLAFVSTSILMVSGKTAYFALLWFLGSAVLLYLSRQLNEGSGDQFSRWPHISTAFFALFDVSCMLSYEKGGSDYSNMGLAILLAFGMLALGISVLALLIYGLDLLSSRGRSGAQDSMTDEEFHHE
jgi:hypothetical protein